MVHRSFSLSSESLILDLLHMNKSLSLEQVVGLLPELSWNQIFTAVGEGSSMTSSWSRPGSRHCPASIEPAAQNRGPFIRVIRAA